MCLFIRPICSGCHTPYKLGYLESCGSMPDGIPLWHCRKREHRYEDVVKECAMCPQEIRGPGHIPKWQTHVINFGMQSTFDTSKGHTDAINTALEVLNSSSGEITLDNTEVEEIPDAMLLIDEYLVDKKWEAKRQKMIEHERKRWGGPYERKKRGGCVVM